MYLFEVYGRPLPQGKSIGNGRIFTPQKIKNYVEMIQWQIRPFAPEQPLTGPLMVEITSYFSIPKSTPTKKRNLMLNGIIHHTTYPDEDNCSYVIRNALKKIVYEDDRQITDNIGRKRWGEKDKIVIKVVPIDELYPSSEVKCA
jgi:Holliday junction resolvase RusA-like endonuclease